MKKNVLWLVGVLTLTMMFSGVYAQKIDWRLLKLVGQTGAKRASGKLAISKYDVNRTMAVNLNADGTVASFPATGVLKDGAACPTELLEEMGIQVDYVVDNLVGMVVPVDKVLELERVEELFYVKASEMRYPINEAARKDTHVEDVSTDAAAAAAGLPYGFTGKDVVVGIVDAGIDFNHAAFRNADGSSRVKKVILYNPTKKTTEEYTTEEEFKKLTTDFTEGSHGSHTSATAVGSIMGNNLQGMAPEADIVLAGLGGDYSTNNINNCINKIFSYADEVGKPTVVSVSLANIIGLHDGSDGTARLVASLTNHGSKPGRVVVIGAGNSAGNCQSIVKTLGANEELKTVLGAEANSPRVFYTQEVYIYADDYEMFPNPELKLVNLTTGEVTDVEGHLYLASNNEPNIDMSLFQEATLDGGKAWGCSFSPAAQGDTLFLDDNNYRLQLSVKPGHDGQTIKMVCQGDSYKEPTFDAPDGSKGTYNFKAADYTKGNGDFTANVMICDDAVIGVGAYVNSKGWTDYTGKNQTYPASDVTGKIQEIHEVVDFSSFCVEDDNGKPRPMVVAPGQGVISAACNYDLEVFDEKQPGVPDEKKYSRIYLATSVDKFNRKNWYLNSQGTSMATPVVSGIIALWLQANPNLTSKEIKDIIDETSVRYGLGDLAMIPSGRLEQSGAGRVDCLAGLRKILGATAIETIGADGRREATPATMYNVDAPVYNVMGQRVDKSQKGLVIYKGRKYLNR